MGFTIVGLSERRTAHRRRGRTPDCDTVAALTELHGWDAVPGARAAGGVCSCGRDGCPSPGAHPLGFAPVVRAGTPAAEASRVWGAFPGAAVMLPAGGAFDVLDVSEEAGRRGLVRMERMGLPLGPVTVTPEGRAQFFVAPGARTELPAVLHRLGWHGAALDLKVLGHGDFVTAPPSDRGGLGPVRWLRQPAPEGVPLTPPPARLLLGTLAQLAHRFSVHA